MDSFVEFEEVVDSSFFDLNASIEPSFIIEQQERPCPFSAILTPTSDDAVDVEGSSSSDTMLLVNVDGDEDEEQQMEDDKDVVNFDYFPPGYCQSLLLQQQYPLQRRNFTTAPPVPGGRSSTSRTLSPILPDVLDVSSSSASDFSALMSRRRRPLTHHTNTSNTPAAKKPRARHFPILVDNYDDEVPEQQERVELEEGGLAVPADSDQRYCASCRRWLRRNIYYHHQRLVREHGSCDAITPRRFPCVICPERLPTIEQLCAHCTEAHSAPAYIKEATFETRDQFDAFLRELTGGGSNKFRMSRGTKPVGLAIVSYYRCNRIQMSERERAAAEAVGRKPRGTSIRTTVSCTAFYRKIENYDAEGNLRGIEVRYCDHHMHAERELFMATDEGKELKQESEEVGSAGDQPQVSDD